jgi:hypothetical protein
MMKLEWLIKILTASWQSLTRKSEGFSILSVQVITNPIVIEQLGTKPDCELIRESAGRREHLTTGVKDSGGEG